MADLIDRDALLSDINEEIEANQEYPEDKLIRKGLRIARKSIENAPTVNHWIPVEDALPEKTGYYLVCDSTIVAEGMRGRQDVSKYVIGRHGGHWYGAIHRECITHWMPLPEPPEEVQE